MSSKTRLSPRTDVRTRIAPRYHVVLLNDEDHTYYYVINMLGVLFGHSYETAFAMAEEVDNTERVVVYTGSLESAELKRDQILAFGLDRRLAYSMGSMGAVVESAP